MRLTSVSSQRRFFAGVFFFSGTASLIYQVVWQRMLTLHYGVGAVSTTLIVSTFLLGLGIGALVGGWVSERTQARVRVYLFVELAMAVYGLASIPLLALLGDATAGADYPVALASTALFLLPPTVLMGMTLPLLVKIYHGLGFSFFVSVSEMYFVNTLGAAAGSVLASFGLISHVGLDGAIIVAALLNTLLGLTLGAFARGSGSHPAGGAGSPRDTPLGIGSAAYAVVFTTGFVAIGYEIVWMRILGVLVKDSPYAFSSILGVYLAGIAFGSRWIDRRRLRKSVLEAIARLQLSIAGVVTVTMAVLHRFGDEGLLGKFLGFSAWNDHHPPLGLPRPAWSLEFARELYLVGDIFLWPLVLLFAPAFFMGACFPLTAALARRSEGSEGSTTGHVYFWNVLGNVAGGAVTGFVLLERLGSERTVALFVLIGAAFVVFLDSWRREVRLGVGVTLALAVLVLLPRPTELYSVLHSVHGGEQLEEFVEEATEAVVVTYAAGAEMRNYVNGAGHGGRPGLHFLFETAEAASFAREVRSALVIGYGTGSVTETLQRLPGVERITVVELSGALMRNLRKIPLTRELLEDPRVLVRIEDGRRYLRRSRERFDLILLDALRTTTAYSNNLYSVEFFRLAAEHLTPGGVLMVWMDEHRVMPKTVATVFPQVRWYRDFCLASASPMVLDESRRDDLWGRLGSDFARVAPGFVASFLGEREAILEAVAGLPVNRDLRPVTEYYLGRPDSANPPMPASAGEVSVHE